jgi:hypothetical protein
MLLSAKLVKPDGSTLFRRYRRKNKLVAVICLLAISLLLSTPTGIAQDDPPDDPPQDPDWLPVAEGIDFRLFTLPDPNNVFVARMHREDQNVTIESSIAQGRLSGGAETVSSMAQRYDQAINFWPASEDTNFETHQLPISFSGNRNNVVVAINGDYTYKDENNNPVWGIPARGQIHSSWYAKRFTNLESGSGFVWKLDRSAFIGECILHPYPPNFGRKQIVTFLKSGSDQLFNGINIPRGTDDLIIYTPQYDKNTLTDGSGIEVLVEMSESFLIRPEPSMIIGVIRAIYDGVGSTTIPFDHVVLSASGAARDELLNNQIEVGDQIGLSQEIRHYEEDCETLLLDYDWTHAYASVGGSFYFLRNGQVRGFFDRSNAIVRNPRTAIAYNDEYIFFIVVDGRNPGYSRGMTIAELADFVQEDLTATHGIALDGGGSSTMVVNGQVVNNTFCNNVFCKAHLYLPLVHESQDKPEQQVKSTLDSTNEIRPLTVSEPSTDQKNQVVFEFSTIQRTVPNGLMMVVVEPVEQLERFAPGDKVLTLVNARLRLGPGTNYSEIAVIPGDTTGIIVAHTNQLDGVLAKGHYWWKVDFDGQVGWMADSLLGYWYEELIFLLDISLR